MKKEPFDYTYTDDNGEEKTLHLAFIAPTKAILQKARLEHNKAFAEAIKSGAILRATLSKYMEDQGLWDEERENKYRELFKILEGGELKLSRGNIKLSEAREIAISMRKARAELQTLLTDKINLDAYTAEGQAENTRFNSLLAQCLVYNDTGKPYFKDTEDYLNRSEEDLAIAAAKKFASFQFGLSEDYESTLPENQFLKKWKFVDDKMRLVDKNGRLIDEDGNLINEFGHPINENGQLIDEDGNVIELIDDSFESMPFLDDDGNPIVENNN